MKLLKVHKECSKLYSYRSKILTFSTFSTFSRSNIFHSFDSYGSFQFCSNSVQLQNGLFQKKLKQGSWGYTFLKPLELFILFTLPLEIPDKTKLNPWTFHKIVLDPLEIPHYFSLVTLGNSTSFLINPWKFHMPFLWYPWKFHIYPLPPVLFWFFLE